MIDIDQFRTELRRQARWDVVWITAVLLGAAVGGFACGWWLGSRPVPPPLVITVTR